MTTNTIAALLAAVCFILSAFYAVDLRKAVAYYKNTLEEMQHGHWTGQHIKQSKEEVTRYSTTMVFFILLTLFFITYIFFK